MTSVLSMALAGLPLGSAFFVLMFKQHLKNLRALLQETGHLGSNLRADLLLHLALCKPPDPFALHVLCLYLLYWAK